MTAETAVYWGLAAFQLTGLGFTTATERVLAPFLPRWRRYLSCWPALLANGWHLVACHVPLWLCVAILVALYWNVYTGLRGMRGGGGPKRKAEARASLTEVMRAAFQRQSMEAR